MIQNEEGIILSKRNYGEKDLLLTLLTSAGERWEVVVKGAQSAHSRRKAHLELMNCIHGSFYHGPKHIYLQNPSAKKSFHKLKTNVKLVFELAIFLEIIERSLPAQQNHKELYELLHQTLHLLNENPKTALPKAALIRLTHLLGFLPSFKQCHACHEKLEEAYWNSTTGLLSCASCRTQEDEVLPLKYCKAFEFFKSANLEACQKVHLNADEASTLHTWTLGFLHFHLERPLKTLALFLQFPVSGHEALVH